MSQSLSPISACLVPSWPRWPTAASESFPVQRWSSRTCSTATTCWPSAHRLGQDARLRVPLVDLVQAEARRPAALVLAPRASWPVRSSTRLREVAMPAPCRSPPSTAASASRSRPAGSPARHIVVATPGRLEDLLQRRDLSLENVQYPRARRGRPHARHGLQARRRPHRQADAARAPDACSSPRRSRARSASSPKTTRTNAAATPTRRGPERRPTSSTASSTSHDDKIGALVRRAARRDRGRALVFVRTKRGADRLVKRLESREARGGRHARQQVPVQRQRALANFESRPRGHARRHRRRGARHRRGRHHPRHQLRCARGRRRLHAPHRPYRPRRAHGQGISS